jgi:transcription initiation factor TFIID subunit TAF12
LEEANFLLTEFVENVLGYRKPGELLSEEIREDERKRIKGLLIQEKSSLQVKYENLKSGKPNDAKGIEVLEAKLNSLQAAITITDSSEMIEQALKKAQLER